MGGVIAAGEPLRVGGGGVHNRRWLQSIARAFARPLDVIAEPDLSAWGAARSAASTLGWIDLSASPDCWAPATKRVTPVRQNMESARARLESFRRIAIDAGALTQVLPR